MSIAEKELTAYHEAGHCVAYFILYGFAEAVSIIPDETEGTLGRVSPLNGPILLPSQNAPNISEYDRSRVEAEIVISYAGY